MSCSLLEHMVQLTFVRVSGLEMFLGGYTYIVHVLSMFYVHLRTYFCISIAISKGTH